MSYTMKVTLLAGGMAAAFTLGALKLAKKKTRMVSTIAGGVGGAIGAYALQAL